MIKQIQLRGISHSPSDRLNSDGGCVESLNVQLENAESVPCPIPQQLEIGDTTTKVLYIHKTNTYTNYIARVNSALYAIVEDEDDPILVGPLESATDPDGVTSIGNILVYNVASGSRYAIFRDGTYQYLGDSIPEPEVTFTTTAGTSMTRNIWTSSVGSFITLFHVDPTTNSPWSVWNTILSLKEDSSDARHELAVDLISRTQTKVWEEVDSVRANLRGNGEFAAPVMARYAMRLYDGNYIYVSAPVILTASTSHEHMDLLMGVTATQMVCNLYINAFTASVRVNFGSGGLWGDLIESVDIFLSTDILVPNLNSKMRKAYNSGVKVVGNQSFNDAGFEFEGVSDYAWLYTTPTNRYKEDFENEMLKKGNFYRVASIPAFTETYWQETLKPKSQDDLVVLPRLPEGEAHQTTGLGGVTAYNNRLLLTGEKVTLSRGNRKPDAIIPVAGSGTTNVSCFFYIRGADGNTKVVKGYKDYNLVNLERARGYVTYPDPRCYKAEYYVPNSSSYKKVTLPMKEHPAVNAAYGFWGLGVRLDEQLPGDDRTASTVTSVPNDEDRTYVMDNRVYLSEMDNPFFFPLGQRLTFSGQVVSAMPITIPLSTGQFGQFQLYIFTTDGIWAARITDEGKFGGIDPVTRDTAFPGSVCQLDQGIVFASESGVMLLGGSQVTNISPNMRPERHPLGEGGAAISLPSPFSSLMTIAGDTMPFLTYIREARFVYDYPGKRVLVFRAGKDYAYVYKLDTGTWHKQQMPGATFVTALNSYPDALVTMTSSGGFSVYDFTSRFGQDYTRYALIITRNLDFDSPDTRKEIRQVKLRSNLPEGGGVKYVLLGSMDGKYFSQIKSLRNGSYKFYRMILMLTLHANEGFSWIDVDFNTKFTNKLR